MLSRKNEQDPVRSMMLSALAEWPRRVWRREHTPAVGRILRDALDAADLSERTSRFLGALVLRIFARDPAWGATWLTTLPNARGLLSEHRLGEHLTEDEVRASAPWLLEVARNWARFEHGGPLFDLVKSLGARMSLVPGLPELVAAMRDASPLPAQALAMTQWQSKHDRAGFESTVGATVLRFLDQGWFAELITLARSEGNGRPLHTELVFGLERVARRLGEETLDVLELLRQRASANFAALLPDLLEADASVLCLSVVNEYLYRCRQDLLTPYLDAPVITGRFAKGETGWLMAFVAHGFHRWTPEQSARYARAVRRLIEQPDLNTWTLLWCVTTLAALDWAPKEALFALVDDARPAVREKAIRVLARCDQGEGLPTLLRCLEDERVRIAVYCLRRACNRMLPERVLSLLSRVPLTRVTVAKEVVRLLGELRSDAAYDRLIALDGTPLHRDVRIALLRALWDHLEREPTWAVFARAVEGEEWVMAARLGDIPADRLTEAQDRRLSALLARVLSRPEPEARISLPQSARLLRLRDAEGTFLAACGARLASPYDDEAIAAMWALLFRGTERDLERLEDMLEPVAADPRTLTMVLTPLVLGDVKSLPNFVRAARAAERVLSRDSRLATARQVRGGGHVVAGAGRDVGPDGRGGAPPCRRTGGVPRRGPQVARGRPGGGGGSARREPERGGAAGGRLVPGA